MPLNEIYGFIEPLVVNIPIPDFVIFPQTTLSGNIIDEDPDGRTLYCPIRKIYASYEDKNGETYIQFKLTDFLSMSESKPKTIKDIMYKELEIAKNSRQLTLEESNERTKLQKSLSKRECRKRQADRYKELFAKGIRVKSEPVTDNEREMSMLHLKVNKSLVDECIRSIK